MIRGQDTFGLLRKLVRDQPQMLAIELIERGGGDGAMPYAEDVAHGAIDRLGLARLEKNPGDAAALRQAVRFLLEVVGRAEDDGRVRDVRVRAEPPHQL